MFVLMKLLFIPAYTQSQLLIIISVNGESAKEKLAIDGQVVARLWRNSTLALRREYLWAGYIELFLIKAVAVGDYPRAA